METVTLPPQEEMLSAFMGRDRSYDGVFVTAVNTTGIFCRPSCPARKPRPENIQFFPASRDALLAGYRPCKRCRPMDPPGAPPAWLAELMDAVDDDPTRRWTDQDLRQRGMNPERVRRWFQAHHHMTFHAYLRMRRLGMALGQISEGSSITPAALDHGYDSLSGFNEAFRKLFGDAPRDTRGTLQLAVDRIVTPLGPMIAAASDQALYLLEFVDRRMLATQLERLRKRLDCVMTPGINPILAPSAQG